MNRVNLTILTILLGLKLAGQAALFSELNGTALEAEVVANYKPNFVEVYSDASQILLRDIYNDYHKVKTFYTQQELDLPSYEEHPTYYFSSISDKTKSCAISYIYPQSKGASTQFGNAHSDLFNLIPIRTDLAQYRRLPIYKEIDDQKTQQWVSSEHSYDNAQYLSNESIGDYNEYYYPNSKEVWIEPSDNLKGDIARSIFYFHTMYRDASMEADPTYFDQMREDLCKWHDSDPSDKSERVKNRRIALYQDNKVNPFILDHTLANRLYCDNYTSSEDILDYAFLESTNSLDDFNPRIATITNSHNQLDISNIKPSRYSLRIYAENGQKLYHIDEKLDYFNTINLWNVKPGLYFVHLFNMDTGQKYSDIFKITE